jgi:hypothetical protein
LPSHRIEALQALAELDDFEQGPREPGEASPLQVNGDRARWEEFDGVAQLSRTDGKWRFCSQLAEDVGKPNDDPNDWAMIYNMVAELEETFARRIEAGEFISAEEAQAAMNRAAGTEPRFPSAPATQDR